MPRRRRPSRSGAAPRAPRPEGDARLRAPLAALFPDGLPTPPPPPPPPAPEPPVISEKELMARAFAALATGAPIDFEALRVVPHMPSRTCSEGHVSKDILRDTGQAGRSAGRPSPRAPTATRSSTAHDHAGALSPNSVASEPSHGARASSAELPAPAPPPEFAALQARSWAGSGWRDEPGRTREYARATAELVARARRGRLPTLRLRGLRREPALVALAAFVARERAARSRYVRVVTGKGLGSPGDPVLKEAVATWCASSVGEAEVSAWAPELDVRGEYGSVILQLRPRD